MNASQPPLRSERRGERLHLEPHGAWQADRAGPLHEATTRLERSADVPAAAEVCVDLSDVTALDATGGWLLRRSAGRLAGDTGRVRWVGASAGQERLLELLEANVEPAEAPVSRDVPPRILRALDRLGQAVSDSARATLQTLGFLGLLLVSMLRTLRRPSIFPWTPLVHHMSEVGVRAFPIVSLIGFLIGTVLAYQGVAQLSRFGADVFVVDLVAISTLREVGILLTAIVVAGRSGSAFAAEIGSMQLSDEIDAMRTMGLDPFCRLVAPRSVALVVMLPLLTVVSNLAALLGGALGAWILADLMPTTFFHRLGDAVDGTTLAVGLVKAPFFALLIALAGCYQGLRVRSSAAELGMRTTRSVVQGIFLVIVMDALFSVFFAEVGL